MNSTTCMRNKELINIYKTNNMLYSIIPILLLLCKFQVLTVFWRPSVIKSLTPSTPRWSVASNCTVHSSSLRSWIHYESFYNWHYCRPQPKWTTSSQTRLAWTNLFSFLAAEFLQHISTRSHSTHRPPNTCKYIHQLYSFKMTDFILI
jgi:hypothetical protein